MAVRLPPQATALYRVALVFGLAAPFGVIGLLMILVRSPIGTYRMAPVDQPIEFDHRHHAGDDAIDCRYCHTEVERAATAGYPSVSTCMRCHAQIWNRSRLLEPLRAAYFSGRPIAWERVDELPWFVYFNHAIHVNKGVGCIECHGRVDLMGAIWQVAPLTMVWCLGCHRDPVPHLRPLDQITSMTWNPPIGAEGYRLRLEVARKLNVHPRTACTTCHR